MKTNNITANEDLLSKLIADSKRLIDATKAEIVAVQKRIKGDNAVIAKCRKNIKKFREGLDALGVYDITKKD